MKSCGNCGKPIPVTAKVGDSCPFCGARWDFERMTIVSGQPERARWLNWLAWVIVIAAVILTMLMLLFIKHTP